MPFPQYAGVLSIYNGVDAEIKTPFQACTIQRIDQYIIAQPIIQFSPLRYSLGSQTYKGGLTIPLYDRTFLPLFRWIISQIYARVAVTFSSSLSHVYENVKVMRATISANQQGPLYLNMDVEALSRLVLTSAYATPIDHSSFPINDTVTYFRQTLSGAGIDNSILNSWDLTVDTSSRELWTFNDNYYDSFGQGDWLRRPFGILSGGLTVTGNMNFLDTPNIVNGEQLTITLGSNKLYVPRCLFLPGAIPVTNPNSALKVAVAWQGLPDANGVFNAIHS